MFTQSCLDLKAKYTCNEKIEFNSYNWEFGWNIKFKKSGKTFYKIYPKENCVTFLVVVGKRKKMYLLRDTEMTQHIIVVEYKPEWIKLFKTEAVRIKTILGENCTAIYHIGSTSVVGLAAKPIIDIMPIVHTLENVDKVRSEFEKIGYEYMGEFGITGRRYLRKGGEERTHQIHIFSEHNTMDIERHLAVRDYLRTHKDVCNKYAILKKELAKKYPYDIDGYCKGKDAFVLQMEKEALEWRRNSEKR